MQFSIIFIDSEGSPIQELSAIEMDLDTREIIDVFHDYAYTEEDDEFCRKHIHGLNRDFLFRQGYSETHKLVDAFKEWMREKKNFLLYGNNPQAEIRDLQLRISDIGLDKWLVRTDKSYHMIAYTFKRSFIPIRSRQCYKEAHSAFTGCLVRLHNATDIAKEKHGFHCSLYDCYELYLYYVTTF